MKKEVRKSEYECMFILANNLSEEKRNGLVEKFSKMASDKAKVEKMGLKKFATEINHKKDGYYYLMTFKCEHDIPKKIGELMLITDGVVRFMFVNKDEQKAPRKSKKPAKSEVKA
ncbi:MAG: 30S ribosomal protein S6 [Firmicutes bacterium]|nr:30S ribosomal protein S6 [Bacillota bacterium]